MKNGCSPIPLSAVIDAAGCTAAVAERGDLEPRRRQAAAVRTVEPKRPNPAVPGETLGAQAPSDAARGFMASLANRRWQEAVPADIHTNSLTGPSHVADLKPFHNQDEDLSHDRAD